MSKPGVARRKPGAAALVPTDTDRSVPLQAPDGSFGDNSPSNHNHAIGDIDLADTADHDSIFDSLTSGTRLLEDALDPTTPPRTLARLARNRSRTVRAAVAANPNTPQATLVGLMRRFPDDVAANPILDWWLLEDPNWLGSIDDLSRQRLLGARTAGSGLLWWASRFGTADDKRIVLSRRDLPSELLDHLATDVNLTDDVSRHRLRGAMTPASPKWAEGKLAVDADDALDLLASARPSGWALAGLDLVSDELRRSLAGHDDLPEELALRLLLDSDDRVVSRAVANQAIPERARSLARRVRASDPSLTADELARILDSPSGRRLAADHHATPQETVDSLCSAAEWSTRQSAALGSRVSINQLEQLAIDDDRDVRAAVSQNRRTPAQIVRALALDRDEHVRAAASAALAVHPQHGSVWSPGDLRKRSEDLRAVLVAAQPNLGLPIQQKLARHDDWQVRAVLAANTEASASVLSFLAKDTDYDVRQAVAANPTSRRSTLVRLARDENNDIRATVARRSDDGRTLAVLSNDGVTDVRRAVALNPATGTETVRRLSTDSDSQVRVSIAGRDAVLSPSTQARLGADQDGEVRAALLRRDDLSPVALRIAVEGYGAETLAAAATEESPADPLALPTDALVELTLAARTGDTSVDEARFARLIHQVHWLAGALVDIDELPIALQHALTGAFAWRVRESLAKRPDLDSAVLRRLFDDTDYDTRAAVAGRAEFPLDLHPRAVADTHRVVRLQMARRVDLSDELADRLLLDEDDDVREAVLALPRPLSPVAQLIRRLQNNEPVRTAETRPLLGRPFVAQLLAGHRSVTVAQLKRLSSHERWQVREAIAANSRTPAEVLATLAGDSDRDVRRAVAGNPGTPTAIVEHLTGDSDRGVVRVASGSSRSAQRDSWARRATLRLARRGDAATTALALSCDAMPDSELTRLRHRRHPDWRVRAALGANARTPQHVLEELTEDGMSDVESAARWTLGRTGHR